MKNKLKDYKARLEFWWARRIIKDGRDFELSFDDLGLLVSILRGTFKKVQFRYANIVVREDDVGVVDFNTVVVYNPLRADVSSPAFKKITTNIMRIILADAMSEHKLNLTEQVMNENRNVDTDKPDQERGFYEESTPLLEKRVSKRKPRKKVVPADSGIHPEIQQPAKPKRGRARVAGKKRPNRK